MGGTNSTTQNVAINHPYFKNAKIVVHENQTYMKTGILVDGKKTIKKWEDSQKIASEMNKEFLLLPMDHQFAEQGFCGSAGVLNILYENYPIILSDQIVNRQDMEEYFQQVQIWYLIYILISSATQFHQRKMKLGDIRPQNIFINKQGQVKLANSLSWPREQNNYFKSLTEKQPTYLAPQQLQQLQKSSTQPQTNPDKGESFSIGLTLLDAVLLKNSANLYNFQNFTFNTKQLQNLIGRFNAEKQYSPFLRNIITDLLHLDPKIRKSPLQIYHRIQPYEQSIKNLVEFTPNGSNETGQRFSTAFEPSRFSLPNNMQTPYSKHLPTNPSQSRYNYSSNLPGSIPQKLILDNYNQNNNLPSYQTNYGNSTLGSIIPNTSNLPKLDPISTSITNYSNTISSLNPSNFHIKSFQPVYSNIGRGISPNNISSNLPYKIQTNNPGNIFPLSYKSQQTPSLDQNNSNILKDFKPMDINESARVTFENVDKFIERTRQLHP